MNSIVDLEKHPLIEISRLLEQAKSKVTTQANSALTMLFWKLELLHLK